MESLLEQLAFFEGISGWAVWGSIIFILLLLGYTGAPLWLWAIAGLAALTGLGAPVWLLGVYVALVLIFNIKPIRRAILSSPLMSLLDKLKIVFPNSLISTILSVGIPILGVPSLKKVSYAIKTPTDNKSRASKVFN